MPAPRARGLTCTRWWPTYIRYSTCTAAAMRGNPLHSSVPPYRRMRRSAEARACRLTLGCRGWYLGSCQPSAEAPAWGFSSKPFPRSSLCHRLAHLSRPGKNLPGEAPGQPLAGGDPGTMCCHLHRSKCQSRARQTHTRHRGRGTRDKGQGARDKGQPPLDLSGALNQSGTLSLPHAGPRVAAHWQKLEC